VTIGSGKKAKTIDDMEEKVNSSVFPGLQGGPHNHTIGALATCLKQVVDYFFFFVCGCCCLLF